MEIMPILIQCPFCKKLLAPDKKYCKSRSGKGCGKKIPTDRRVYYIQYLDPDGKTRQKKIGPNKEAAKNALNKFESQVAERRYIDRKEANKITVKEHIDADYIPYCETRNKNWGLRNKKLHCKYMSERWGAKLLQDVSTDDLEDWRNEYLEQGKETMWNRVFQNIRAMYRRAVRKGIIDSLPFDVDGMQFSEDQERVRWLTADEEVKLLEKCSERLRPVVIGALNTGLRKTDLLGLRLGIEVDLDNRQIRRKQDKTNSKVDLYITDQLLEVFRDLTKDKKLGEKIFSISDQQLKDDWLAALEQAEIINPALERIKDFHFHDLRHCFACKLVKSGVDLFTVSKLLGQKSVKMTMRYAHLQPDTVVNAMSRLSVGDKLMEN